MGNLVNTLIAVTAILVKQPRSRIATRGRELLRGLGNAPYPVGYQNVKVGGPSTYRGIDSTCPEGCAYRYGGAGEPAPCYGKGHPVSRHEARAGGDLHSTLGALAIAVALAIAIGTRVRLHTVGDFLRATPGGTEWDPDYQRALVALGQAIQDRGWIGPRWAWGYSHAWTDVGRHAADDRIRELAAAGIMIRQSDQLDGPAGGAIVYPFEGYAWLRRTLKPLGVRPVKCPAQVTSITCADCNLCADRPDLLIVFAPHGSSGRDAVARRRGIEATHRALRDRGVEVPDDLPWARESIPPARRRRLAVVS